MYGAISFAIIFIMYEVYKMLNMGQLMPLIEHFEQYGKSKNPVEKEFLLRHLTASPAIMWVIVLDIVYFIFALVLLFTAYWYIGFIILGLSFSKILFRKINVSKPAVWQIDCVLSIAALGFIIVFSLI